MAEKREKLPSFTSPKGTLKYPKLTEPDYGNDEYPKPDGEYSTKLVLLADSKEAKAFIKLLTPLHAEAIAKAKEDFKKLKPETRKKLKEVTENALFTALLDPETEEETGEIEFKFAMKASGVYKKGPKEGKKWTRKPTIFDAKGEPIVKKVPSIWGGSEGRVSFQAGGYFIPGTGAAGLKLSLEAVQLIKLVTGSAKNAKEHGFEAEEGYEYEEVEEDSESEKDGESDTPDEAEDF